MEMTIQYKNVQFVFFKFQVSKFQVYKWNLKNVTNKYCIV